MVVLVLLVPFLSLRVFVVGCSCDGCARLFAGSCFGFFFLFGGCCGSIVSVLSLLVVRVPGGWFFFFRDLVEDVDVERVGVGFVVDGVRFFVVFCFDDAPAVGVFFCSIATGFWRVLKMSRAALLVSSCTIALRKFSPFRLTMYLFGAPLRQLLLLPYTASIS